MGYWSRQALAPLCTLSKERLNGDLSLSLFRETCEIVRLLHQAHKEKPRMRKGLFFGNRRGAERGQGLVEYSLIIALVAIVVIAILVLMGPQIGNIFSTITNGL